MGVRRSRITVVVDANYFLRLIVEPEPDANPTLARSAVSLFAAAREGRLEFTTSEAVISEVV